MGKIYILPLALVLFASVAFASGPYFFTGYVHINGSLADNGTIVEAYINGASLPVNAVVLGEGQLGGTPHGWYSMAAVGNPGDTVTFRVNNLTLVSANGTNTSAQTLTSTLTGATGNFNLSVNKSSTGSSCLYAIGCSSGFCSSNYCCDTACTTSGYGCANSGSIGTCSANTTSSSGSSGSSGGGGGSGSVAVSETASVQSVSAGSEATVSISNSAQLGIQTIEFTPTSSLTNVQVTVKETTATSAGTPVAISSSAGAVYKYLEITKTGVTDSQISSATINFKVPKSWFTSNNIDKSTVALNRFKDGSWTKLDTTIKSEDSTYIYFSSSTPGFSTFAVTGEKATQPAACGNNLQEGLEDCDGTDLAGASCTTKGYTGGTLKCVGCTFDTNSCTSGPAVTITSPSEGQTVYGTSVTVSFTVGGVTLTAPTGSIVAGEGHLHLFLDERPYVVTSSSSYTFEDVPYGSHTLRAELQRGDHSAFTPTVTRTISFSTAAQQSDQPPVTGGSDYTMPAIVLLIIIVLVGGYFLFRPKKAR